MDDGRNGREGEFDCVIVGAGPGGLQASIHLARFNHRVLLFHKPGGRTRHARRIENYLGHRLLSGADLIETGLAQATAFGVTVENSSVESIGKEEGVFTIHAAGRAVRSPFVVAASGARESLPPFGNVARFFGTSYLTCLICDGYRTMGKKLLVIDRTIGGVRTSIGMKRMFTRDVTFLAQGFTLPEEFAGTLEDEGIPVVHGRPEELLGDGALEGVRLADGRVIPCELILGWAGIALNDGCLRNLPVARDADDFKIVTGGSGESTVPGLFVVGSLRQGHSQAIIAAGQGAEAALEISRRIVEI